MAGTELYDDIGTGYSLGRRTDPRWMTAILDALGGARSIADVGAGTGSYEPDGRTVLAIEPSSEMIRQRPAGAAPAVRAVAEGLPVRDHAVDAALAVLTVHHWTNWRRGLTELRRIAPRQVVLAYDARRHTEFWLVRDYVPEIAALAPSTGACAACVRTSTTAGGKNNTTTFSTSTIGTPASASSSPTLVRVRTWTRSRLCRGSWTHNGPRCWPSSTASTTSP